MPVLLAIVLFVVVVALLNNGKHYKGTGQYKQSTATSNKQSLDKEIRKRYVEIEELKRQSVDLSLNAKDREAAQRSLYGKELETQAMVERYFNSDSKGT